MPALSSLQSSLYTRLDKLKASASLLPLRADGEPDGVPRRFQYWPESIQDSKSVNWNPRDIPGGSLPLYQWINSGERVVSFEAVFSSDMDLKGSEDQESNQARVSRLKAIGAQSRNVDPRAAVAWLRQFQLPSYGDASQSPVGVPIAIAPQQLILDLPNVGLGVTGGLTPLSFTNPDQIVTVLLSCDITYEAFFPSGLPRVTVCSLSFGQSAQLGGNAVIFPTAKDMMKFVRGDSAVEGASFGYNLEVVNRS